MDLDEVFSVNINLMPGAHDDSSASITTEQVQQLIDVYNKLNTLQPSLKTPTKGFDNDKEMKLKAFDIQRKCVQIIMRKVDDDEDKLIWLKNLLNTESKIASLTKDGDDEEVLDEIKS